MGELIQLITYQKLFWIFMAGNILGVIIEGIFCVIHYGHWETHTVTIWGPFCLLYGIGAVLFFIGAVCLEKKSKVIQFIVFSVAATIVEFVCGVLLKYGLRMKAWDYSNEFLNFKGLICLKFTLVWGIAGVIFSAFCINPLNIIFAKMTNVVWKYACTFASIFMAVNLLSTAACIARWSDRHFGAVPHNRIEQLIDEKWNDEKMEQRFCEWRFIE